MHGRDQRGARRHVPDGGADDDNDDERRNDAERNYGAGAGSQLLDSTARAVPGRLPERDCVGLLVHADVHSRLLH